MRARLLHGASRPPREGFARVLARTEEKPVREAQATAAGAAAALPLQRTREFRRGALARASATHARVFRGACVRKCQRALHAGAAAAAQSPRPRRKGRTLWEEKNAREGK
jgi:hypothetical protein